MALKRIRLVRNWRHGLKFRSNQILMAIGALQVGWPQIVAAMPASLQASIGPNAHQWVTFVLVVLAIAARFVDQGLGSAGATDDGSDHAGA